MKLKSTQRKSLATVPSDYQGQERKFAQSVSESLDILTGRRGDIIDRAVTFRDLLDTGVLKLVKAIGTGSTTGGTTVVNPSTDPDGFPVQLPTQPENFVAAGGFDVIFLSWTLPPYNGHDYVEIYRLQRASGAAEPTLAQAEDAGVYTRYYGDVYRFTDTNVGSQENWYYWIRAVNKNGIAGAYYSSTGVNATTALDYLYISGLIDDILDDDVNNLGLNTSIDALSGEIDNIEVDVTALNNFTGYLSSYNGSSLIVRMGDVETVAGNAATSAQLQTESTTRANADSALSTQIATLNSTVTDPTTGLAATYSGLQTEITTRANADSALATRTTNLESTVNDATTGVAATYSGLVSEQTTRANADTALASDITTLQSDVSSNQAQIQTEATTRANADSALSTRTTTLETSVNDPTTGLSATYSGLQTEQTTRANADSALSSSISTLTSTVNGNTTAISTQATTINGIQGKYAVKIDNNGHVSGFGIISTANDSGTITSSFIVAGDRFAIAAPYNATSAQDTAVGTNYPFKVFTTATTVNGVSIPAGVYIDDAFIHNAQITNAMIKDATITTAKISDLSATKITSGNIQINAANDIKIYQGKTSFTSNASGFWLGLNNNAGSFHVGASSSKYLKFDGNTGDLITSGIEVRASDGTVLVDAGGLRSSEGNNLLYNGGFVHGLDGWTTGGGTVNYNATLARAYTDVGEYIDSDVLVPVNPNEPLYVYADFYGANAYCAVIFYKSDGTTYTSTFVQGSGWSPSAASSQAFRVGKVDYPSYSGNPWVYAKIRFGTTSSGSQTTTWHQVGVSTAPPVIDPSYASTYIRDLSVDTLQIAGNAITLADSSSTPSFVGSGSSYTTHSLETGLLPEGSAIVWFVNAIVNDANSNPSSYDLIIKIYTKTTSGSYVLNSTRTIWIYSYGLDSRIIKEAFPATHSGDGYMKCEVRLQQHNSSTLVNGGGIEISYVGAKK